MCGVPHHAIQGYVDKLIKKGYKVAICEQMTDPALSKGLVERDVIRVVTPGTVTDGVGLSETDNNYILSLFKQDERIGVAYCDVSTGAFYAAECAADEAFAALMSEVSRVQPSEIIFSADDALIMAKLAPWVKEQNVFTSEYPEFAFERNIALDSLKAHFKVAGLSGYGLDEQSPAVCAAGALIDYLKETQKNALSHINTIRLSSQSKYMALDMFTRSNLELTKTLREGKVRGSLFGVLDHTKTSMGARLLKRSIGEPLQDIREIDERLDAVQEIVGDPPMMDRIAQALDGVFDLERLITRIAYATLDARNCLAIKKSLAQLPELKKAVRGCSAALISQLGSGLDCMEDIYELLGAAIDEDAPAGITEGGFIKQGYNAKIDELKRAAQEGLEWIASLEASERTATGIKNLKIGYNKVFGYYIEVTKSNLELVPYRYIRKQTLANCERFVTPELKEMEEKLLGAEEKCIALEYECFVGIRGKLTESIERFQTWRASSPCWTCCAASPQQRTSTATCGRT